MAFSQAMRWAVAAAPIDAPPTAKANQPKAISRYTRAGQVLRIGFRLGGTVALYRFWCWIRRVACLALLVLGKTALGTLLFAAHNLQEAS
jgi:hypothetical protein